MATARVFQINISDGGVPKCPVRAAEITALGVTGDTQKNREVHGGPERALCLFSLERIMALQEEGHPVFPGSTGENLTVSGLPWDEMVPGVRLLLGSEVRIEITSFTAPCPKIAESFVEGNFRRCSQDDHPGSSRVYARVLRPGPLRVGDAISLIGPVGNGG